MNQVEFILFFRQPLQFNWAGVPLLPGRRRCFLSSPEQRNQLGGSSRIVVAIQFDLGILSGVVNSWFQAGGKPVFSTDDEYLIGTNERLKERQGIQTSRSPPAFRDRLRMRNDVSTAGVPVPAVIRIPSRKDPAFAGFKSELCRKMEFPVVAKPVEGASSSDIYMLF